MANKNLVKNIKGFDQLRALLSQAETGREEYLYPQLNFGDVWWIPDSMTGFSNNRSRHPWVIVNGYRPHQINIVACPRTSSYQRKEVKRGILTSANILPGLEKEGLFVLKHRRTFSATQFHSFEYVGRLPEPLLQKIQDFYAELANGKIK